MYQNVAVARVDGRMYFANVNWIRERLGKMIALTYPPVRRLVLCAARMWGRGGGAVRTWGGGVHPAYLVFPPKRRSRSSPASSVLHCRYEQQQAFGGGTLWVWLLGLVVTALWRATMGR